MTLGYANYSFLYAALQRKQQTAADIQQKRFVKVPLGFAQFPKELPTPPRAYINKRDTRG